MKTIAKAFAISALTVCAAGAAQAATVTTLTDLKMRSGPGTGYAAVTTLPQGVQLHLGDCTDDLHWCKVYWRGREGWASSHYLSEPGDAQPEVASRAPTYRRYDPPRRLIVSGGDPGALAVAKLASEAQLRAWTPDHPLIRQLAYATDSLGLCVFSRSPHPDYDVAVRAFPAGVGIVEDPASGAANGLIAAWIAWHDPQDALVAGYRVSQGREMGHDALLNVSYDDAAIWVGGATDTVIRGEIHWD